MGAGLLCERLFARREELERAVFARAYAVDREDPVGDPTYIDGLRAAVPAGLDYAIAALAGGESRPAPIPADLLSQARRAARERVPLDTVVRRYLVGHRLLEDFTLQEFETSGLPAVELQRALRTQAATLDHLVEAAATEYRVESEACSRLLRRGRAEVVERLLSGEAAETLAVGYDFDAWHLGAVGAGPGAEQALRELAAALGRPLLAVPHYEEVIWAWFGGTRKPDRAEISRACAAVPVAGACLALGEPAQGLAGWRLSHRQAKLALPIAVRRAGVARYGEVALLASAIHDDVLADSLQDLYLMPFLHEPDGQVLCQTLRAYFAAERNITSAAAALGASRPTVRNRLARIEDRLGRSVASCAAEVETALSLRELELPPPEFLPV